MIAVESIIDSNFGSPLIAGTELTTAFARSRPQFGLLDFGAPRKSPR